MPPLKRVEFHRQNARTPLLIAVENGSASLIQPILDAFADVNHPAAEGRTALDVAVYCVTRYPERYEESVQVVRTLIRNNAMTGIELLRSQGLPTDIAPIPGGARAWGELK
jgi:hypothetical protein